jgi:hypothetical protein
MMKTHYLTLWSSCDKSTLHMMKMHGLPCMMETYYFTWSKHIVSQFKTYCFTCSKHIIHVEEWKMTKRKKITLCNHEIAENKHKIQKEVFQNFRAQKTTTNHIKYFGILVTKQLNIHDSLRAYQCRKKLRYESAVCRTYSTKIATRSQLSVHQLSYFYFCHHVW